MGNNLSSDNVTDGLTEPILNVILRYFELSYEKYTHLKI